MRWLPAVLVGALILGWGAAYMPVVAYAMAGLMVLVWIGPLSLRYTKETLSVSFFVLLLAATDFRTRDPYASVQVAVDFQVAFELFVYFLLFLVAIRALYLIPRERLGFSGVDWVLAAYVGLAAFSVLWTPIVAYTTTRVIQLGTLLFLSYTSLRVLGPERTVRSVGVSVVAYVVLFALIAAPTGLSDWLSGERLAWFAVHPIQAGTLAGIGAIFLLTDLHFGARTEPRRGLKWLLLAFLVVVLIMTHSRGPILAFAVAAAAIIALRYSPVLAAATAAVLFVLMTLVAYNTATGAAGWLDMAASSDNVVLDFLFRGQSAEQLVTLTGRLELWEAMVVAFWESPIIGHGYQAARVVGMEIATWAGEAHNAVAQSLLDLGILGTVLLMFTVIWAVTGSYLAVARRGSAVNRLHASIFGLLLFMLVNSVITASFAGTPGYELLVLLVCIMVGERLRRFDRATQEMRAWERRNRSIGRDSFDRPDLVIGDTDEQPV